MSSMPRAAVGAVQSGVCSTPMYWALLDVLNRQGLQTQCFESKACLSSRDGALTITGLRPRHLDSWVMSRELCREIFFRAAQSADVALICGTFAPQPPGSNLGTLCDWLRMSRVGVIDVSRLREPHFTERPPVDALLLDHVADAQTAATWQRKLQQVWDLPVLGWLPAVPVLRAMIAELPAGTAPTIDLCRALGQELEPNFDLGGFQKLCRRQAFGSLPPSVEAIAGEPVHVAVAYDEAFHGYFPDALDMLESRGAVVRDFSPLVDEALPSDTDVVYIGCGRPQHFAQQLAENQCLLSELRNHVCAGRRIYGEGGGLAYLSRELVTPDGQHWSMVGVLPAIAQAQVGTTAPQPVEVELAQPCWLGAAGTRLRGYRNPHWELEPAGVLQDLANGVPPTRDLVGRRNAIGSRVHLHLCALAECLNRFTRPLVAT